MQYFADNVDIAPVARQADRGQYPLTGWLAVATLLGLLISGVASAQSLNPLENDPRARAGGGALFRAQCATCHGADARGIQGIDAPDLTQLWSQPDKTDGAVFETIRDGIPGSIMPPHSFTDTEIWMLVTYLKSTGTGASADSYTGDAGKGASLFASHCSECHRVAGTGGSLGPDLTRVTASRSRQTLEASIRNPSAAIARGYQPVTLVTDDNRQYQGTLKSEDAFSVQIMDVSQNLRGFRKADLAEIRRGQISLMPPFDERALSGTELDDLLSYLASHTAQNAN